MPTHPQRAPSMLFFECQVCVVQALSLRVLLCLVHALRTWWPRWVRDCVCFDATVLTGFVHGVLFFWKTCQQVRACVLLGEGCRESRQGLPAGLIQLRDIQSGASLSRVAHEVFSWCEGEARPERACYAASQRKIALLKSKW